MERLSIRTGVERNVLDNLFCLYILVKPEREKDDNQKDEIKPVSFVGKTQFTQNE